MLSYVHNVCRGIDYGKKMSRDLIESVGMRVVKIKILGKGL